MTTGDTVWIIEEPKKKKPTIELDQIQPLKLPKIPKSPAIAFSLSLLIWGAGQFYNRQKKLGFLFLGLMIPFYLFLISMFFFWNSLSATLQGFNINHTQILFGGGILFLSGLLLWVANAFQAYHRTAKGRIRPFRGVHTTFWPFICSCLFPGWGQFLNGQPLKGIFFIIFSLAGLSAITTFIFAPIVWPTLEFSVDRLFYENILSFALLITPLVALMWFINVYDAMTVSRDPLKKESWKKRLEYAVNNYRAKGWKRALLPRMKVMTMLALYLILSLSISTSCFPKAYYVSELQDLQTLSAKQNMVVIPKLINQILNTLTS